MESGERGAREMAREHRMERYRSYAEAIEALNDYRSLVEQRQEQVDTRYASGKGYAALTKLIERDAAKMRYALEQMQELVAYMFCVEEDEVREDMELLG